MVNGNEAEGETSPKATETTNRDAEGATDVTETAGPTEAANRDADPRGGGDVARDDDAQANDGNWDAIELKKPGTCSSFSHFPVVCVRLVILHSAVRLPLLFYPFFPQISYDLNFSTQ